LRRIRADISIAQLLELSPETRKLLKTKLPIKPRRKSKIKVAARAQAINKSVDVKAVELEATIVDKVLPNTLVDGGSSLNIMPLQTMEKLGLSLTGPSPIVISMANQSPAKPVGQIKDCQVMVGGESYTLTIHVIQTHALKDSFPLLLGRPWLRASEAVVNWGGDKPHISFGPSHNRSRVRIQTVQPKFTIESSDSSENETLEASHQFDANVHKVMPSSKSVLEPSIHCLGPSLYHWHDDGDFAKWLEQHPNTDSEPCQSVNFIEGLTLASEVEINPEIQPVTRDLVTVNESEMIDREGEVDAMDNGNQSSFGRNNHLLPISDLSPIFGDFQCYADESLMLTAIWKTFLEPLDEETEPPLKGRELHKAVITLMQIRLISRRFQRLIDSTSVGAALRCALGEVLAKEKERGEPYTRQRKEEKLVRRFGILR